MKVIQLNNKKTILVVSFLFFYAQYIYIPFQVSYLTDLGATAVFVGIVTGAYGGAQFLLRLPIGVMADRVGRHKKILVAGTLLAGAACGIRVLFSGTGGFLAASILSGVGSATWLSFMVMNSGFYEPEEQQKASGKIIFAYNAGVLAAFVTGTLLYQYGGMKLLCLLGASASIPGIYLCFRLTEAEEKKKTIPVRELLKICGNRKLIFIAMLALVQQGIQMATTMSFTTQILKNLGAGKQILGYSSIIYMIFSVVSSYFSSSDYSRRRSSRFWMGLIFAGLALYCIFVPTVESIAVIMILQIIPGWASGLLFSILTAEAMTQVPAEKKSTAMGFFQAVYALGMTFFPIITGKVSESAGMRTAYYMLGLLAFGCAAVVWGGRSKSGRHFKLGRRCQSEKNTKAVPIQHWNC